MVGLKFNSVAKKVDDWEMLHFNCLFSILRRDKDDQLESARGLRSETVHPGGCLIALSLNIKAVTRSATTYVLQSVGGQHSLKHIKKNNVVWDHTNQG